MGSGPRREPDPTRPAAGSLTLYGLTEGSSAACSPLRTLDPSLLLGVVDQVEFTRQSAFSREKRRSLGSVLRSVIHDMHEHLPDGHPAPGVKVYQRDYGV